MIYSIIFDWKRTLYDPDSSTLIDGVLEVLSYFANLNIPMYLIGKGNQKMRDEAVRLDVAKYFADILFVEGSKNPKDFLQYIDKKNPQNTLVIGDRIRSELKIGKSVGATTIWFRQGKFSNEEPANNEEKPNYTVSELLEILELKL